MKNVEPYLIFNGNCEQAFTFYQSVFGGKLMIMKYRDMPEQEKQHVPAGDMDRVIHVLLRVNDATAIMGSDSPSNAPIHPGDNVFHTLNMEDTEEAKTVYEKLSAGGKVTMPLGKTFFADQYAMFSDKFGIHWMIMYSAGKQ